MAHRSLASIRTSGRGMSPAKIFRTSFSRSQAHVSCSAASRRSAALACGRARGCSRRWRGSARSRPRPWSGSSRWASAEWRFGQDQRLTVHPALLEGKLQVVLADYEEPPLPTHVLYPEGRQAPAKVRTFVDMAAAALRGSRLLN